MRLALTYKGHVQQIISIERAAIVVGHWRAQALRATAAQIGAQIIERQRERVDRVHDELHLRLLLVSARLRQSQIRRAEGETLIAGVVSPLPPQSAAEHLLPILAEPRIPPVVLGGEPRHVLVKMRDVLRVQLDGDSTLGLLLETLHQLALSAPAVAGQPLDIS